MATSPVIIVSREQVEHDIQREMENGKTPLEAAR